MKNHFQDLKTAVAGLARAIDAGEIYDLRRYLVQIEYAADTRWRELVRGEAVALAARVTARMKTRFAKRERELYRALVLHSGIAQSETGRRLDLEGELDRVRQQIAGSLDQGGGHSELTPFQCFKCYRFVDATLRGEPATRGDGENCLRCEPRLRAMGLLPTGA